VPDYAELLGQITEACHAAGHKAQGMRPGLKWETKPDGSIVTEADRAVERDLRDVITQITPGAAVWGEEFGYDEPNDEGFWMLDPIDGTSNFTFGQPLWGVTAAYMHQEAIQFGVIRIPDLDWTLTGMRGHGAHLNGSLLHPLEPGPIRPIDLVGQGDETAAAKHGYPGKVRHIGAFVFETALFLQGGLRALVTDKVCLYDAAAGIVMAREVGAEVRALDGGIWDENPWARPGRCAPFGFFPPGSGWPFQSQ
jgi:myo-inositol-1(or 4)-monophosphatase